MANNSATVDVGEKIFGNETWSHGASLNTTTSPTSLLSHVAKPFETEIVIAVVLGVLLVTMLFFALAVFIDCRHQRLDAENSAPKRISPKKSRIPTFVANSRLSGTSDELAFVNEMCNENSSTTAATCATSDDDIG